MIRVLLSSLPETESMADWKQALLKVVQLLAFLGLMKGTVDLFIGHVPKEGQPVWVTILSGILYISLRFACRPHTTDIKKQH